MVWSAVPLLRVLVLAFALAHATGLSDALEAACADECTEKDCDGACPPLCPACHCVRCPIGIALPAIALDVPRSQQMPTRVVDTERVPSSPDPREILHVPIALRV